MLRVLVSLPEGGLRHLLPRSAPELVSRLHPAGGGRIELAATSDPRHVPTAASWSGEIALGVLLLALVGRSEMTSSDAGSSGAGARAGIGAAAIVAAALSCQPALTSRRAVAEHASRSTCAVTRATSLYSACIAKWRTTASATSPPPTCAAGGAAVGVQ